MTQKSAWLLEHRDTERMIPTGSAYVRVDDDKTSRCFYLSENADEALRFFDRRSAEQMIAFVQYWSMLGSENLVAVEHMFMETDEQSS